MKRQDKLDFIIKFRRIDILVKKAEFGNSCEYLNLGGNSLERY